MTDIKTETLGRPGRFWRRATIITFPLLVVATQPVAAHGGAGYGGGMMGGGITAGGSGGLFGGTIGLFGLLWMALVIAIPVYLIYVLLRRDSGERDRTSGALAILRERYASGDLSEEEFERRRAVIERTG